MIWTFANAHPILFTILALPVIVTACVLILLAAGVHLCWKIEWPGKKGTNR